MGLFYDQIQGLYSGYKAAVAGTDADVVTFEDVMTMNIFGDLEDLEQVFDVSNQEPPKVRGIGHCSALIRLLPNNSDMYSRRALMLITKTKCCPDMFLTTLGTVTSPC